MISTMVKWCNNNELSITNKFEILLMDGGHEILEEWLSLGCVVAKGIHSMLQHKQVAHGHLWL